MLYSKRRKNLGGGAENALTESLIHRVCRVEAHHQCPFQMYS